MFTCIEIKYPLFLPCNQDNFHGPYDHTGIDNFEYVVQFHNQILVRTYHICYHIPNHFLRGGDDGVYNRDGEIQELFDGPHEDVAVDDDNLCDLTIYALYYHLKTCDALILNATLAYNELAMENIFHHPWL